LAVLRSWFLVIAIAAVLAGVAAYLVSGVLPPSYEATAKVHVRQTESTDPNVDLLQAAQNLSNTYAEVATTGEFIRAVMTRAGIREMQVEEFANKISVSADSDLPFIDIVVTDSNRTVAVAIAQAMVDELIAASQEISGGSDVLDPFLEQDLATIQRQIEDTRTRIARLQAARNRTDAQEATLQGLVTDLVTLRQTYATLRAAPAANRLTLVDPPVLPDRPVSPRPLFNTAISAILALLVATGVAFVWERLDDRVRTPEDVERVTGLPTIGTIIRMPTERGRKEFYRLATLLYPRSVAAEAFRAMRTNLEFASLDRPLRMITVTSSVPGEGKSVVSGNLAVAFAQAGRRTILVDGDLRRPGLHTLFSLQNTMGLTDMVLSDGLGLANVAHDTEEPNLRVVTSGAVPANPAELLGSQRMAVILQRILADADLVILDTPPVGLVTDAALAAARSDSTLLVVSPDQSSERMVRKAREALAHVNARVAGVVLNNVSPRDAHANPYYGLYRPDEKTKPSPIRLRPRPGPTSDSVEEPRGAAGGSEADSEEREA
jgi:capsular exopolysaccharide synthesis family protein